MTTYRVVRFFEQPSWDGTVRRTISKGLTLEQAQAHCTDPETSSTTATSRIALARTSAVGKWFDGYEEEK